MRGSTASDATVWIKGSPYQASPEILGTPFWKFYILEFSFSLRKYAVDDTASVGNPAPSKRKPNWGCITATIGIVLVVYLVFRTLSPSDWVDVAVRPMPEGIEQIILIAEDSEGVEPLDWYESKLIPFTIPAHDGGWHDMGSEFNYSVQWKRARRYGVLTKHRDDRWLLWWLEPEEVTRPSLMRYVIGGGRAEIHLPGEARAEKPSREFFENVGVIEGWGD